MPIGKRRDKLFTMVVTNEEREDINTLAEALDRSAGDAVRQVVKRAVETLPANNIQVIFRGFIAQNRTPHRILQPNTAAPANMTFKNIFKHPLYELSTRNLSRTAKSHTRSVADQHSQIASIAPITHIKDVSRM